MSLIEGVGDEVVQFIAIVLAMLVGLIAWWSTNARPDRYRPVMLMRSRPHSGVVINFVTRPSGIGGFRRLLGGPPPRLPITLRRRSVERTIEPTAPERRVIPVQEMDSIVDADMAMLDNNRLHFYRRMDSAPTVTPSSESTSDENEVEIVEEGQSASNEQIREMDSIVSAMEADGTTGCDLFARPSESNSGQNSNPSSTNADKNDANGSNENAENASGTSSVVLDSSRKILIKLKYINDTLKEVDGNLDELLKDFKRRHFSAELGAERRVRLIFRGRVLGDEAATLGDCGLHDNAVVHCLVHPNRSSRTQRSTSSRRNTADTTNSTPELLTETQPVQDRAWDLEYMLMTLVSVALTVVWFFRCEYSNMFTASASVALFSLTVFYGLAIFGLYLSDTFHLERRPATPATPVAPEQPLPDN